MIDPKFKVIAELRNDLTTEELSNILNYIKELKEIYGITQSENLYYKTNPSNGYGDFGAIASCFCYLKDKKNYFAKLEYYDLLDGETKIAV